MSQRLTAIDGSRLRALRILKKLGSQQEFANAIGVPQSHISDLEQGKLRSPSIFLKVTDRLECTTDFIFRRGPFRNTTSSKKLRSAACQMAFDVFKEGLETVRREQRDRWIDRCARVIGHRAAPVASEDWTALAEQLDLVMGTGEPQPRLKVVRRGVNI